MVMFFFGVDVFNKKLKPSATSGRRPVCNCACVASTSVHQKTLFHRDYNQNQRGTICFFFDWPARDHQVFFALTEKHIGGSLSWECTEPEWVKMCEPGFVDFFVMCALESLILCQWSCQYNIDHFQSVLSCRWWNWTGGDRVSLGKSKVANVMSIEMRVTVDGCWRWSRLTSIKSSWMGS